MALVLRSPALPLLALFILFVIIVGSSADDESRSKRYSRRGHGLGVACNHESWTEFHRAVYSLFEKIKNADPKSTREETGRLIKEDQERISNGNYSDCLQHLYLECSKENYCACINQAPPFNFELKDGECLGKRGAICVEYGDSTGCMPGLKCLSALAGDTSICDGREAFDEELKIYRTLNGSPRLYGSHMLLILSFVLAVVFPK